MAEGAPARCDWGTAPDARQEAPRARCLLRHHREQPGARSASVLGSARLAQVAQPPVVEGSRQHGSDASHPAGTSPSRSACCPLRLPCVAKPLLEEPDAGNPHVRVCGSPGGAIPRGDPATRISCGTPLSALPARPPHRLRPYGQAPSEAPFSAQNMVYPMCIRGFRVESPFLPCRRPRIKAEHDLGSAAAAVKNRQSARGSVRFLGYGDHRWTTL
jgi:hypothetical protein